ncbi:CTL-like protein DDB_G0274487 [Chenopodium quinoa]|uniref:Choline transporter-like protein n=1 Tax=Chenopodium quinoa TaxID=63459 RepID=A0A803LGF4_CHEQI|nr:CTL-like protein DDB_G0274487 [Chenopodium quinoa]
MASSEEPSKSSNLYDTPSSPTQPLLSKPYLSSPIEEYHPQQQQASPQSDSDRTQFLQIAYNYGPRTFKDLPFLILFLLFALCTFGFGIFSIVHHNSNFSSLSSFSYDPTSSSCVKTPISNHGSFPNFYGFSNFDGLSNLRYSNSSSFVRGLIWVLVITFVLSLPIVWGVLLLLKHYTKQLVYVSLPFFIVIPIGVNVYWFVACTISSSCSDALPLAYRILVLLFVFLVIGVIVWIFVINWHRIELTINIIGIASDALSRNLGLFGVVPCLKLGLLAYYVPIVVFLVFARYNGKIVPRESKGDYHCAWKQDSWVGAYYALAILTMLWSATVMLETKAYVVSGTVAQWYFSKDDSTPKRKIRSSLRNAFGPSAGTICFSGLIMFIVRLVRAAVDSARQEEATGIVNVVLRCCVKVFMAAVDFLNKFTINFAAITGEAYCTSARMTYELLKRNLLSAVFVETISARLLGGIIFVLSAVYAVVVCAILNGVTSLGVYSYYISLLAWLLLIVMLGFFVHLLDDVIDTIYVCYAIDRDRAEVNKPEVHNVYVQLPISRSIRTPPLNV